MVLLANVTLRGRTALVTGATRGVGRTIALHLARAGATIAVNGRTAAAGKPVVEEIEALGGSACAVAGAIETKAGCEAIWQASVENLGVIDILVNAAAVRLDPPADGLDDEEEIWQGNVLGPLRLVGSAAEAGMRSPGGAILNIGAFPVAESDPLLHVYRSSQAILISGTRSLASTLAAAGIRINVLAAEMGTTNVAQVIHGPPRTEFDARITPSQPAEAGDVAATALYLVSDASAPTTGAVFSARTSFG